MGQSSYANGFVEVLVLKAVNSSVAEIDEIIEQVRKAKNSLGYFDVHHVVLRLIDNGELELTDDLRVRRAQLAHA